MTKNKLGVKIHLEQGSTPTFLLSHVDSPLTRLRRGRLPLAASTALCGAFANRHGEGRSPLPDDSFPLARSSRFRARASPEFPLYRPARSTVPSNCPTLPNATVARRCRGDYNEPRWILFQGEVKFLTGGNRAAGVRAESNRKSATLRRPAPFDPASNERPTRLTPVKLRDQRLKSGWKRQISQAVTAFPASGRTKANHKPV